MAFHSVSEVRCFLVSKVYCHAPLKLHFHVSISLLCNVKDMILFRFNRNIYYLIGNVLTLDFH